MPGFRFSIDIAAPRDQVFDLWTDIDRLSEWIPGVTRVSDATGPGDTAGTRYKVWFGFLSADSEVLAAERPYYVRQKLRYGTIRAESSATFEAYDGGTRIRAAYTTRGLASRVWARILAAGTFRGSFRDELAEFARLAEREADAAEAAI